MSTKTAKGARRTIRCYLCGHVLDVSTRALSINCPGCHRAIKIEDVVVKSYLPVNDLQTCGRITITSRGRVAAKRIQSGDGIVCEGTMEGTVETEGEVTLGPKASWRGRALQCRLLSIADGAKVDGNLVVPWTREAEPMETRRGAARPAAAQSEADGAEEAKAMAQGEERVVEPAAPEATRVEAKKTRPRTKPATGAAPRRR
jgi:cytoskeletal protein CcmA (bactofilin family)